MPAHPLGAGGTSHRYPPSPKLSLCSLRSDCILFVLMFPLGSVGVYLDARSYDSISIDATAEG